jgi:hypothetical protein
MDVVASWTGERADALREALRMTNEAFAAHLDVAVRTVAAWRTQPDIVPRPVTQEILDAALALAPAPVRNQFGLILAERGQGHAGRHTGTAPAAPLDVGGLTTWITATNTSDAAIEHLEQAMITAAARHTQAPAREILADVLQLHGSAQLLLRGGKQRLRQTRELIRLDGSLLAHASVLLGDLGQDQAAENYGHTALLWLQRPRPPRPPPSMPWRRQPGGNTTMPPPRTSPAADSSMAQLPR